MVRATAAVHAAPPLNTPPHGTGPRRLCAQRLEAEIATASDKFILVGRGIDPGDTNAPHPNIRAGGFWNYLYLSVGPVVSIHGDTIAFHRKKGAPIGSGRPGRLPSRQSPATGRS